MQDSNGKEIKLIVPVGGGNPTPIVTIPITTELIIGTDKYNINDKGDAVDVKGITIKTKTELETLKTSSAKVPTEEEKLAVTKLAEKTATINTQLIEGAEVEIDDKKYKLNKDGSAIDETGKVIKTKADLTALYLAQPDITPEINYVDEIQKATNITIASENGQPITYENTVQGLVQREQDVFKEGSKLGRTQYEQELFNKFPILNSVIEHLTINGSLKDFIEDIDYSKITITDDENQQIDIFTKAKLAQGLSQQEITDMVKYYKEDKKLKSAAEVGLTYLNSTQITRATQRATQVATANAEEDLKRTTYLNEVNKALINKKLTVGDKTFVIPEVIKVKDSEGKIITRTIKDFQEYIEKPLNFKIDGEIYTMTQLQYDETVEDINRTPHHDLLNAYRKFTKYDDSQLINANINSNIVKQVIKLSTKANVGGSGIPLKGGKLIVPIK